MRIGMVTACYIPVQNGITRMVSLYKKHLELAGHEVFVFTIGPKSEHRESGTIISSPGFRYRKSGYFISFRYNRRARQLLKQMDLIHCHHPLLGLELSRRYASCPIVFTSHTRYDLYTAALTPIPGKAANRISSYLIPIMLQKSDWIIAPTGSMRDLLKGWGVAKPIEVIGNGIELNFYRNPSDLIDRKAIGIAEDGVTAIYVGRLSPEKGVDTLLSAYSIAKTEMPDLSLLLVGDGPSRHKLEKQAVDLKIRSSVRFIGQVPFHKIPSYLALADFFVSASRTEVHPLTVMEAMAAALPIVGVRSPGLNGLVEHGKNALLCGKSFDELARGIIDMAGNRNRRLIMSEASVDESEKYDIRRTIEMSLNLYYRVLSISRNKLQEPKSNHRNFLSSLKY
ncbi:MAG: glycosyltransferase family 4 protein [Anaerolineae bacterium]|nr:MAG: glycosyltransferase family 4 protein [Anaerolineae bacterium]